MGIVAVFVICCFAVGTAQDQVILEPDQPFLSVKASETANLKCCYTATTTKTLKITWFRTFRDGNKTLGPNAVGNPNATTHRTSPVCSTLTLKEVTVNHTGLYQCKLNGSENINVFTHGTYLQVYKPLGKTINLSESTKNNILMVEGLLLLLCVMLPSANLIFKSKRVSEKEKKKMKKEEENIYQGLNLDDCCSAYDQIERSHTQGQYQDVCNIIEEEEEIQLEKP